MLYRQTSPSLRLLQIELYIYTKLEDWKLLMSEESMQNVFEVLESNSLPNPLKI